MIYGNKFKVYNFEYKKICIFRKMSTIYGIWVIDCATTKKWLIDFESFLNIDIHPVKVERS